MSMEKNVGVTSQLRNESSLLRAIILERYHSLCRMALGKDLTLRAFSIGLLITVCVIPISASPLGLSGIAIAIAVYWKLGRGALAHELQTLEQLAVEYEVKDNESDLRSLYINWRHESRIGGKLWWLLEHEPALWSSATFVSALVRALSSLAT